MTAYALTDFPITHGGVKPVAHPRLGRTIASQTAVRYVRFCRPVTVERLELSRSVYGRHVPSVPTHAAHLIVSVLDKRTARWNTLREVDLPPDPVISGEGLSQSMRPEEMDVSLQTALAKPPQVIELGKVETDHLRVECDREHPVWPSHGECNGSPYSVPFGILDPLVAMGISHQDPAPPVYNPLLKVRTVSPRAPRGMKLHDRPNMLLFAGRKLSVGFSLRRPMLLHLGWDAFGGEPAGRNRLIASKPMWASILGMGGFSGPLLRTLDADAGSHLWTGEVSIRGNKVSYRRLRAIPGVEIDLVFTVEPDRLIAEVTQRCERATPVIEAEALRLAWDTTAGPTAAAAMPTLLPGRNGDVELPALWSGDGIGALACSVTGGAGPEARLQVESYHSHKSVVGGLILAPRPQPADCLQLPAGTRRATVELEVASFEPQGAVRRAGIGVRRHWGTVFACFRPEHRGFSNHAASVNCHTSQAPPIETVAHTRRPTAGPDPIELAKFTVARALLDGGGYGYFRNLYLDSDPSLLSAAGRIHQARPDASWLREIEPGLLEATQRMAGTVDDSGLVVCRDLSGNSGSFRWSSNACDVVGFGHFDAYVNAWSYRAFRNAAALLAELGRGEESRRCRDLARGIRESYAAQLLNPETGWVAGWRSRDGKLHDYAFLWINGPAVSFGLLDPPAARKAMKGLEALRDKVGLSSARLGLPMSLLPIRTDDHMLPRMFKALQPTFENYCDGSLAGSAPNYYLRALSQYGPKGRAKRVAADLDDGFAQGMFSGGMGGGQEFRSWDGMPTGYEGTLIVSLSSVYALAIEQGVIQPRDPEWWPEGG